MTISWTSFTHYAELALEIGNESMKYSDASEYLSKILDIFLKVQEKLDHEIKTVFATFDPTYAGFDLAKRKHENALRHVSEAIELTRKKLNAKLTKRSRSEMCALIYIEKSYLDDDRGTRSAKAEIFMMVPSDMVRFCEEELSAIGVTLMPMMPANVGRFTEGQVSHEPLWNTYEGREYGAVKAKVIGIY